MKRLLSFMLALLMALSLAGGTFASEEPQAEDAAEIPVIDMTAAEEDAAIPAVEMPAENETAEAADIAPAEETAAEEIPAAEVYAEEAVEELPADDSSAEIPAAEEPVTEPAEDVAADGETSGTCGDNLTWTLQDGVLTISGTGKMKDYKDWYPADWYNDRESITSVVIGDGVTGIGNYAFKGCSNLTRVTIGSGVARIGEYAFDTGNYNTPVELYISDLAAWCRIEFANKSANPMNYGYNGVSTAVINKLYINGVLTTEITVPDNVTSLNDYVFYGFSGVTEINIGSGVTSIGSAVFANCPLTCIYIPANVTTISGTYYSDSPFYRCDSNAVIFCEAARAQSGWGAYWNYYWQKAKYNVYYGISPEENEYWKTLNTDAESIVVPDYVTVIPPFAFKGCTNLSKVTINNGVTEICYCAFTGCSSLPEVTLPETVTSIEHYAFYKCTGLTSVYIPSSVTSISSRTDDSSQSYAEYSPFAGCSSDLTIYCEADQAQSGWDEYWNWYKLNVCYGVSYADYTNCWLTLDKSAKTIEIPSSITKIPGSAFKNIQTLCQITIPNNITGIGESAFADCDELTDIYIYNPNCDLDEHFCHTYYDNLGTWDEEQQDWVDEYSVYKLNICPTIHGYAGSTAETYARANGLTFVSLGSQTQNAKCDLSGDGKVNVVDALRLFRAVNGQIDALSAGIADLNGDGQVNIVDALKLFRYVNGQIDSL